MSVLATMVPMALTYAAPILLAALGGLYSERSGVVNIALEGIMMVGAFAAAAVTVALEPDPMAGTCGILAGCAAGITFSLLHAFACIHLKADQVVSGTALNILAGGLTVYLCQIFFDQQRTSSFSTGITKVSVPGLASLPVVIFQFAMSPYKDWQQLAWVGAVLITLFVLLAFLAFRARAGRVKHKLPVSSMPVEVLKLVITGASTGTTRKSASAGVIADYQFVLPPQKLVEQFERRVSEIRLLLTTLVKQIVNLRRTRDLLLPRLLSGQVELKTEAA